MTYQWTHTDARGFGRAIPEACARARAKVWAGKVEGSSGSPVADLRALVLGSVILADHFSDEPTAKATPDLLTIGDVAVMPPGIGNGERSERGDLAAALLASLGTLAQAAKADGAGTAARAIVTADDGAPKVQSDAAWLQIAAICVLGAAVQVAMVVYLGQKAAEVVDRELARRAESARLAETHAKLVELAAAHKEQEDAIGHPLPLSVGTKEVMRALSGDARALASKTEPGLPSSIPNAGTVAGWGWASIAVVAIGVVLWATSD